MTKFQMFAVAMIATAFVGGNAMAQTAATQNATSVPVPGAQTTEMPSGLKTKLDAVCTDKAVKLSDKAQGACNDPTKLPKVTKAGLFRNAGIGAEFNTLIRQH